MNAMAVKKGVKKSLEKGFVLIMKNEKFFKTHNSYKIIHGGKSYPIIIKGIPCVRAGHKKHHGYYDLKVNFHEVKTNDLVEITKDPEDGYSVSIMEFFKNAKR
jgi:hypothetical protein